MPKEKRSEFGTGFVYNLVLFAKHYARLVKDRRAYAEMRAKGYTKHFTEESANSLWFNGAGDHFSDLKIPKQWQKKPIGKLAVSLRVRALKYRMENVTTAKCDEFFADFEKLTRMVDKALGVESAKADWN